MFWLPPMTMNLQPALPACVIDTPLALSPYGLTSALRLAHSTRVWLSRRCGRSSRTTRFYLSHPAFVACLANGDTGDPEATKFRVRKTVEHWRKARDQLGLDVRERLFGRVRSSVKQSYRRQRCTVDRPPGCARGRPSTGDGV
jgi:hypothetical protein